MGEMEKVKVLVLMWHSQNERCINALPDSVSENYTFFYQQKSKRDTRTSKFATLLDYVDDAKRLIKEHGISVVLGTTDIGAILSAALAVELPELELRVPSLESVFVCNNKYYTRCNLDPDPIPFALLDLSAKNLQSACDEVASEVPFPEFFKPCSGARSIGVQSVATREDLFATAQSYIAKYGCNSPVKPLNMTFLEPFYEKYVDSKQYPLCFTPSAIVEKHMGSTRGVNADGCVFEGEIIHWMISDSLYHKNYPSIYLAVAYPTQVSTDTQDKVWKLYDEIASKMIEYGFDNQFVNMEIFVLEDGNVQLMEVNPRLGVNVSLCSGAIMNQNAIEALLKMGQGIHPGKPVANGRHAFYAYISTLGCGRCGDFLDYSCPDIVPLANPDDYVDGSAESGGVLARVCLEGGSREEVTDKYKSICDRALLKPEFSTRLDHI